MCIGALWQDMYRGQYFEGGRVLTGAISAVDIALHDIAGKALGVPVYQLLGGKQRDLVPCFATTGAAPGPGLIDEVKLLMEQGWNVIRTVPGHPPVEDASIFEPRESLALTASWLTQVREEVGPEPVLGIDYHCRLSVAEAASFCQRMPSGTLDFIEEPIRDETPEAYESLRSMVDVPFAIGEEFSSKWAFLPYIERGITNFARIDVCNVGGLTESMKVAGMAEGSLYRLNAAQPVGSHLHRRNCPLGGGNSKLRVGLRCGIRRQSQPAVRIPTYFRCNLRRRDRTSSCPTSRGLGSSSTKSWLWSRPLNSGRRLGCAAATAPTPIGEPETEFLAVKRRKLAKPYSFCLRFETRETKTRFLRNLTT